TATRKESADAGAEFGCQAMEDLQGGPDLVVLHFRQHALRAPYPLGEILQPQLLNHARMSELRTDQQVIIQLRVRCQRDAGIGCHSSAAVRWITGFHRPNALGLSDPFLLAGDTPSSSVIHAVS